MCETDCVTAAGRKQQTARLASSSERESQNLDSNMLREKKNASGKHLILMTAFFKKLNLFGRDIDTSGIVNQSPRED